MTKWTRNVGLAATVVLVLAACSSNDTTETTTEPAPAPMESIAPEDPGTIADVASANPDFSTLVAAVDAAGLTSTLAGEGQYTVFAPTNEAFDALPAGTVDSLLEPKNKEQLASILTYHVIPSGVMAADVTSGEIETVNGATLDIQVGSDGTVTLTDGQGNTANVVVTDIVASNGVIHVIDAVLLPPEK